MFFSGYGSQFGSGYGFAQPAYYQPAYAAAAPAPAAATEATETTEAAAVAPVAYDTVQVVARYADPQPQLPHWTQVEQEIPAGFVHEKTNYKIDAHPYVTSQVRRIGTFFTHTHSHTHTHNPHSLYTPLPPS